MHAVLTHSLVVAADRYVMQEHPAPRLRRAHAVSKLMAAYFGRPEVVAAAALHEVAGRCGYGELKARFGEPTARLAAEAGLARDGGRMRPHRSCGALEALRLRRLSPEAQSIRVATLIQRTMRLLNQPLTLARVGLSQTLAELALAALEHAHPVLHSIARKLCGAASRRLAGVPGV